MRAAALDVLACPQCLGPLAASLVGPDEWAAGTLRCNREGLAFPIVDGVPRLVRSDRARAVQSFAAAYSDAWRRDGWGGGDVRYLLGLPCRDTTGRQRGKWRVKARSMDALLGAIDPHSYRYVVDLGCGVGWLSHHLARRGHEVFAVDVVLDRVLGLAAAGVYVREGPAFERVWGELERPPFRSGTFDAVVCNASLHYARDLDGTLEEISRILRPEGVLAILNSPVHRRRASAERAEREFRRHLRELGAPQDVAAAYHHFVRSDLEERLLRRIGPSSEVPFDPGFAFRSVRRMKGVALGMELASFPILLAAKRAGFAGPERLTRPDRGQ